MRDELTAVKIALGTVQFGMDYGINNKRGHIPENEVFEILDFAMSSGIRLLDTARAYGNSEEVIGSYARSRGVCPRIVSKHVNDGVSVEAGITESLKRLSINKLYGYLIHHYSDYRANPVIWEDICRMKKIGAIEKAGFSFYCPDELEHALINASGIDMIQVPYSVLDRRFEPYFSKLTQMGIEIQVRSIFLQGLVFKSLEYLQVNFPGAVESIDKLHEAAAINGISVAEICLMFALANLHLSNVIVGVDSAGNLREIIAASLRENIVKSIGKELEGCAISDENILLPFLWNNSLKGSS